MRCMSVLLCSAIPLDSNRYAIHYECYGEPKPHVEREHVI